MLQFVITVSKMGDTNEIARGATADIETGQPLEDESAIPTRPLNARSLALSALLGTHPPTLSASALVALAELFDITGGAMRTALSRLVAAGDVDTDGARYTLSPRLADRQQAQDAGRRLDAGAGAEWDGRWHTAVAVSDHRSLAQRRQVRVLMTNARFGELRPATWLRPANLPAPVLDRDWLVTTGPVDGVAAADLVARLWDVDALAARGRGLDRRLERAAAELDRDDPRQIPPAFILAAEVLRALRSDPLLPRALLPAPWPFDALRDRYARFEHTLQAMLRPFLSDAARAAGRSTN
jgi:phenylacetic acid degradation operon negative regulatory protein